MSQEFFDPELFADFIAEAKEHLETIEPNLLELEKAPENLALLNDIFRPMHSLKGASGFLGLNRINQLAHKSENILDELRKGSMVVTSEIMDVILASTDALRQMIDNLESSNAEGDVAIEHIIAQIDSIMAGESAPAVSPAPPIQPVVESTQVMEAAAFESPASESSVPNIEGATIQTAESTVNAAVQGVSPKIDNNKEGLGPKEWIASLPLLASYALTSFGEGHLKDFIDESSDIVENLNDGLLKLEENPTGQDELVHDIFRFFHNMKGNSGIIGYNELNALTHEAETLLNNVRQGKIEASHELIDLLLLVVDVLESLVQHIDVVGGTVNPFDTSAIIKQLQQALNGGVIMLPAALVRSQQSVLSGAGPRSEEHKKDKMAKQPAAEPVLPVIIPAGTEEEDIDVFRVTVRQQMEIIRAALETLQQDGSHKDSIDALYRCLVTVKNACAFVGQTDIKVYAERTAGIVDQGRKSGIDFSLMVDLLSQETGIIDDMVQKALLEGKISVAAQTSEPESSPPTEGEIQQAGVSLKQAPAAPEAKAAREAKSADSSGVQESQAAPLAKAASSSSQEAGKARAAVSSATKVAPAPAASNAPTADAHKGSSTIRVDHERLDHLMNLIGELIINRNRYSLIARSLEDDRNVDIAQVAQSLSETTYAMARISDDLQDTIMKVRMVPVSSVFSRFPRLVRDLSRKSGKEVDLIMEGEETELDKSVVEVIGDPLVHLIRNSVDHGIEPEDVRIAAGKSPKGKVTLRAFHKGNSVAIEIEDDGKGIDPEKMREIAVSKGVITPEEAAQLDDRESIELIFAPGFSSAEKITDISGRGVGMDVVRTNIKSLKGSVNTYSEIGKGTRFTLSLPLTLAIIDALMVNVAGQMYAIPLDAVSETTKIEANRLTDVKGRKAVTLRGEVLGIVELSEMLGLPKAGALSEVLSVVVIHDNERRLGLVVDRLLERQEVVIKPLGAYLGDLRGISGATIMGDGSVILILDPHEIYIMATSKAASMSGVDSAKQQGAAMLKGTQL